MGSDIALQASEETVVLGSEKPINRNDDLPDYVLHEVEHYKQRFNWDCGISCVIMLLSLKERQQLLDNFDEICKEEGFGNSTWTIDLCYLLKRFHIEHMMYSITLGVNEGHKQLSYYKNVTDLEHSRIQHRFEEATSHGIRIKEGSVSFQFMLQHLAQHGPIILLVDAGLLVCDLCKHNKFKYELRRCFGGSYMGHYIVIVGFREIGGNYRIFYRDPTHCARICATTPARLEAARLAPGTDEDLILIYNNQNS